MTKSKILVVRFSDTSPYDGIAFHQRHLERVTERFRPC
uniref:Uncharacterized protein n=2 Tax=Viruses TaxID=10239 RepID=A0AAU8GKD0_9CAUD